MEYVKLNNGVEMPILGFGVYQIPKEETNDFTGKTVIPFCTSTSSGLGESGKLLEEMANGGKWLEGHRFSSNPTDTQIEDWLETIK